MEPTTATPLSQPKARLTGCIYLLYFLTAIAGALCTKGLVVPDDAAATANNFLTHTAAVHWGFVLGLLANAWYVAVTALFYGLFKPVSKRLALVTAFFSLQGCAVQIAASMFQVAPLIILQSGAHYLGTFTIEQRQSLALLCLNLFAHSFDIAVVFFAAFCLLTGVLIRQSAFLPRILGTMLVVAGVGWLTYLVPPLVPYLSGYVQAVGFLAEVALMVWLLAKGVDEASWQRAVANAAAEQPRP